MLWLGRMFGCQARSIFICFISLSIQCCIALLSSLWKILFFLGLVLCNMYTDNWVVGYSLYCCHFCMQYVQGCALYYNISRLCHSSVYILCFVMIYGACLNCLHMFQVIQHLYLVWNQFYDLILDLLWCTFGSCWLRPIGSVCVSVTPLWARCLHTYSQVLYTYL